MVFDTQQNGTNRVTHWWWRLVRFGFRLLYNEFAFTYDTVSKVVSFGAWRCWQRAALKHLDVSQEARVLELAHGTGDLQLDLHTAGYRPIGCDLSPYMGRIAAHKLRRAGFASQLARARADRLPFATNSFEAVICTFPTDFIFQADTLTDIRRILRPNGQLIIVPNGVLTHRDPASISLEWLYRITGQRGGDFDLTAFFAHHGFAAVLTTEPCPRSIVQVVVARKSV
jgi:ubiquinone/menaquinone biosynthesis C-methylase UbiE